MAKRKQNFFQLFIRFIEAVILLPFIYIISWILPYNKIYSFSKKVGKLLLLISPKKKDVLLENLKIVSPDINYSLEELEEIYQVITGYEFRILLEMISFSRMSFQELLQNIRIRNPRYFYNINHEKEEGFIAFTLHYGNWELLGSFLYHIGIPLACLVERQFNPFIDKYLQKIRKKLGIITIYNEISHMRKLLSYKRKGGSIALVGDQTYWFDPLFIDFFGKEVAVPRGIADLVLRLGKTIFYGYTKYSGQGKYLIEVDKPFIFLKNSDNKKDNIKFLMQKIYNIYEKTIVQDVKGWYTLGQSRWELTKEKLEEWKKNPDSSQF